MCLGCIANRSFNDHDTKLKGHNVIVADLMSTAFGMVCTISKERSSRPPKGTPVSRICINWTLALLHKAQPA